LYFEFVWIINPCRHQKKETSMKKIVKCTRLYFSDICKGADHMTSRKRLLALLAIFICCNVCAGNVHAAWSNDPTANNAICTAANGQYNPTITSDGSSGAIITWQDNRSGGGSNTGIYAQRINVNGVVQWTADGVAICTQANGQSSPTITSDSSGGAIITWVDFRSGKRDIYAQRINASGVVQWTANGVAICTAVNDHDVPTITVDGSGGAIITWHDVYNGNYTDIYAQRINATGVVQWTAGGVAICTAANIQSFPTIISDDSGGAIITWTDYRSGKYNDIYAQRINANGVVQWTANGVAICADASEQNPP
jgi:hypothetical protein